MYPPFRQLRIPQLHEQPQLLLAEFYAAGDAGGVVFSLGLDYGAYAFGGSVRHNIANILRIIIFVV